MPMNISLAPSLLNRSIGSSLPGLVLVGTIAGLASWTAALPWAQRYGLSALTLSILFGMALGNTLYPRLASAADDGVRLSKGKLLRAGVILYGFRITFQQIAGVGWAGFLIDATVVATTFLLAVTLGVRLFKLDRETSILIGAGSAICGAAAVMATESVLRPQAHKTTIAVATVVVFGTLAMFLYPLLQAPLQLTDSAFGVYVGSTVHEVAQVVAAGNAVSEEAAATAVIVKMLRVMLLAPFLLILGSSLSRGVASTRRTINIPWFAVLFIVASGIHSAQWLPVAVVEELVRLDGILLAMAMAALGLHTQASAIRQAGAKPILLASCLFLFLMVGGYAINRGIGLLV